MGLDTFMRLPVLNSVPVRLNVFKRVSFLAAALAAVVVIIGFMPQNTLADPAASFDASAPYHSLHAFTADSGSLAEGVTVTAVAGASKLLDSRPAETVSRGREASAIPLSQAFWVFASGLIGFVLLSNRRSA